MSPKEKSEERGLRRRSKEVLVFPFEESKMNLPPMLTQAEIGEVIAALQDPTASSIAPLYERLFLKYDGVFVMPNQYGGLDLHVGNFDLLTHVLRNDAAFPKPYLGPFEELVGKNSLFGIPTYEGPQDTEGRKYITYRLETAKSFNESAVAAKFDELVVATQELIASTAGETVSLAEYTRKMSARFSEITLGQGIEFPEGFVERATSIVYLFFRGRLTPPVEGDPVNWTELFEMTLGQMKADIASMIEDYKAKFPDGKVDRVKSEEDILGSLIWLSQNIPAELEGKIDKPILEDHEDQLGAAFSLISGGLETSAYALAMAHVVLANQPDVAQLLKARIREAVGEDGFSYETIMGIPEVQNFIDQLINWRGPSFELQRTAGPMMGDHLVKVGEFMVRNNTQIKLHLAHAVEQEYGGDLNTPIDLDEMVGTREGFGDGRRKCVGQKDAEAYIVALLAGLTFDEKTAVFEQEETEIDDLRGIVRFVNPQIGFRYEDEVAA